MMSDYEQDFSWAERAFFAAVFARDRERSLTAIKWLPPGSGPLAAATGRPLLFAACAQMLRWAGDCADQVARLCPPFEADARTIASKAANEFGVVCLALAVDAVRAGDLLGAETHLVVFSTLPPQESLRDPAAATMGRLIAAIATAERALVCRHPVDRWEICPNTPSKQEMRILLGKESACLGMVARLAENMAKNGHPSLAMAAVDCALQRCAWPTWHTLELSPFLDGAVRRLPRKAGARRYFRLLIS